MDSPRGRVGAATNGGTWGSLCTRPGQRGGSRVLVSFAFGYEFLCDIFRPRELQPIIYHPNREIRACGLAAAGNGHVTGSVTRIDRRILV